MGFTTVLSAYYSDTFNWLSIIEPFNIQNQNNMETKKVVLNNETVLEVGNTYIDNDNTIFEVLCIGNKEYFLRTNEGNEVSCKIDYNEDILPYTPPTPKKEWKTFLIEHLTNCPKRAYMDYLSRKDAEADNPHAVEITEVKLNIEPVNS